MVHFPFTFLAIFRNSNNSQRETNCNENTKKNCVKRLKRYEYNSDFVSQIWSHSPFWHFTHVDVLIGKMNFPSQFYQMESNISSILFNAPFQVKIRQINCELSSSTLFYVYGEHMHWQTAVHSLTRAYSYCSSVPFPDLNWLHPIKVYLGCSVEWVEFEHFVYHSSQLSFLNVRCSQYDVVVGRWDVRTAFQIEIKKNLHIWISKFRDKFERFFSFFFLNLFLLISAIGNRQFATNLYDVRRTLYA